MCTFRVQKHVISCAQTFGNYYSSKASMFRVASAHNWIIQYSCIFESFLSCTKIYFFQKKMNCITCSLIINENRVVVNLKSLRWHWKIHVHVLRLQCKCTSFFKGNCYDPEALWKHTCTLGLYYEHAQLFSRIVLCRRLSKILKWLALGIA